MEEREIKEQLGVKSDDVLKAHRIDLISDNVSVSPKGLRHVANWLEDMRIAGDKDVLLRVSLVFFRGQGKKLETLMFEVDENDKSIVAHGSIKGSDLKSKQKEREDTNDDS